MKPLLAVSATLLIACIEFFSPSYSQSASQKSVKLEYSFAAGNVKYLSTSKIIQTMDIEGQSMQANVFSTLGCTIKPAGKQDGYLKLEVKIDTMGQNTESPQGYSGGAVADAIGKTFNLTISPSGKETDLSGAANIVFYIEGSGRSDLSQSFTDYFPDLPEKPVTPGYAWSSTDTVRAKSETMSVLMIIKSENTFEGFETVDGTECAKIVSVLSGSRDVKTQTQGMDIRMRGPFTGSGTLFFAPVKGYFLKHMVTTKMDGSMEITSPEAMTFPVVMDMTSVNEVVK